MGSNVSPKPGGTNESPTHLFLLYCNDQDVL